MSEPSRFNARHPAVKRIMQEIRELQTEDNPDFKAEAIESNIFEWHFAIRGPPDTEFEGGIYHGRILLPSEYPFKPPEFILLTPNGRWETSTKICLSISSHHPEHWQPSWSVRTALLALIGFMPTSSNGAIGSLDFPKKERQRLAALSRLDPPKFGNSERQEVSANVHLKMLSVTPAASPDRSTGVRLDSVAQPDGAAECSDSKMGPLKAEGLSKATPVREEQKAISNADLAAAHREAAARRASSLAAQQSPQENEIKVQEQSRSPESHRAVPEPTQVPSDASAEGTSSATGFPEEPAGASLHPCEPVIQESRWEERGLNFLAIALVVAILAILGRKALAGTDISDFQ